MKKVNAVTFKDFLSCKKTNIIKTVDDLDFQVFDYVCAYSDVVVARYTTQDVYDEIQDYPPRINYYIKV